MRKSSISTLRSRIGSEPPSELVRRCCVPLANMADNSEAFYAGLRLVAIDGSCFDLPDEANNAQTFGYPGSRTSLAGHAGYPQARCVVLVEYDPRAVLGANLGSFRAGEWSLCADLLPRLQSGMLCMADRGFNGFEE